MTRRLTLIPAAVLSIATAGCGDGTGAGEPSWLRANIIADSVTASFEGSGKFWVISEGRRREFGMIAHQPGAEGGTLLLFRRGGGRPSVGDYALGEMDLADASSHGFSAVFDRQIAGMTEEHVARSGVLRVRSSERGRISGTFELELARHCVRAPQGPLPGCALPWDAPADAPTLRVTGEFSVRYDDNEVEALLPEELPIPGT